MALDITPKQEGGKLKAVASGTLPSGQPVVVNADGTVSVIEGNDASLSSEVDYLTSAAFQTTSTFDSNSNKVVTVYRNGSDGKYYAVVGTVSGGSISFGTPVDTGKSSHSSGASSTPKLVFDSNNNKVVFVFSDGGNSGYGTAIVGTVSGTSISFGTATVFESSTVFNLGTTFDTSSNQVMIAFNAQGASYYGQGIMGSVSGTSISFGSRTQFNAADSQVMSAAYDSVSDKIVIAYKDSGNSNYGTAIVGTVSGTSISFGSPVVFESNVINSTATVFDSSNGKIVILYWNGFPNQQGTAVVGTVSGTSISFGSPVVYQDGIPQYQQDAAVFDTVRNQVIVANWFQYDTANGLFYEGTVSGDTINFASPIDFNSGQTEYISVAFDSNENGIVFSFTDAADSDHGTAVVYSLPSTNLTSENYIGISTGGAVADGDNAVVDIVGTVSTNQTGLTAGQQYYVQTDGTLSETPADPSVLAGTALSSDKLIVKT